MSKKLKCPHCGKPLQITKRVDDGSTWRAVIRGRGWTGEEPPVRRPPRRDWLKIKNTIARNASNLIEARCSDCRKHVEARGRSRALAMKNLRKLCKNVAA